MILSKTLFLEVKLSRGSKSKIFDLAMTTLVYRFLLGGVAFEEPLL
jgi:hypothetical protein